ncbi:hypothetical protein SAMN05216337_107222 [Bradyrhizobium brasilense]|uniref:Uncharacterized protein n=1 Tax=Bradyrhizobium brasilense TaxID=1419277 RepID=A0A1G7NRW2_9BRAD|nr:hypothetical protein [Bradyrhizobium brasilense]SDF76711.1 hypothetical protein SAMN05216337_107222 [Bradyrhizobium brasilense]
MRFAMPLLLAETTRINVVALTRLRMPDDMRAILPRPLRRSENALSVNASTRFDSQGTQTETFQAFRSSVSIRPIDLLENAPVAPEIHLTTAANWVSGVVNGAETRKPSSFTMLSIPRRIVARKGEANTTNAVAILQAMQPKLGTAPSSWGLDPIKTRCARDSSAGRACKRPPRGHGDVLSLVG